MKITKFQEKVYNFVKTIPKGQTRTYKEVAIAIGSPMAYRAVGNALNKNPRMFDIARRTGIPCHRVIKSDGSVGGFAHGAPKKIQLLNEENPISRWR